MASQSFTRADGSPKTVIVTGGAGGIGAQTIRTYHSHGCNVVIADLPISKDAAETLISSLPDPNRAMYYPTNIVDWVNMREMFKAVVKSFGQVDVVVANAGMMESENFYDFEFDEEGELKEPRGAYRTVDVNLKGTMNNKDGARGSVILIASTSGYFGGTGVVGYISSKHGVVGLCRSSQRKANEFGLRVNVVAPFFTPTYITGEYSDAWRKRGLPANTVEDVAKAVVETSMDPQRKGHSVMVAGKVVREIETVLNGMTKQWLGEEIADVMVAGGKFFDEMGGYPMPKPRPE
ncbi:hypothetical protein BDV96DRAFT_508419 [Lophiotrema nucula]|uniref:NAD(P)-binding protein n=1 Tax=Lophiotrema nucula TaxID=690887 RepID=A0A6A5YJ36_9PLEO|nr:hypothetical protein BDV96DRAFT_508419 [Lophiotrema nucula]